MEVGVVVVVTRDGDGLQRDYDHKVSVRCEYVLRSALMAMPAESLKSHLGAIECAYEYVIDAIILMTQNVRHKKCDRNSTKMKLEMAHTFGLDKYARLCTLKALYAASFSLRPWKNGNDSRLRILLAGLDAWLY